jgi:NADH-quinone oxidoreductase subunit B
MTSPTSTPAIQVLEAGLACCGVEAGAVDVIDQALESVLVTGQSHASLDALPHILVVAGTVTHALAETVRKAYEDLAEPRVVVAFGACAITGGPYWDSYSVIPGADHLIPVDFHVPGCPPTPQDLARALAAAVAKVHAADGNQSVEHQPTANEVTG